MIRLLKGIKEVTTLAFLIIFLLGYAVLVVIGGIFKDIVRTFRS